MRQDKNGCVLRMRTVGIWTSNPKTAVRITNHTHSGSRDMRLRVRRQVYLKLVLRASRFFFFSFFFEKKKKKNRLARETNLKRTSKAHQRVWECRRHLLQATGLDVGLEVWDQPYSFTLAWMRCKLSFALLRSSIQ